MPELASEEDMDCWEVEVMDLVEARGRGAMVLALDTVGAVQDLELD